MIAKYFNVMSMIDLGSALVARSGSLQCTRAVSLMPTIIDHFHRIADPIGVRSIFLGHAAARRQALHWRKSGQRMFSRQHLMAITALAPTFDQWCPAPFNRFPTMQLQALSTMPDPIGSLRVRQRS